jgi:hypothetical protein
MSFPIGFCVFNLRGDTASGQITPDKHDGSEILAEKMEPELAAGVNGVLELLE